jgi:Zn-dependent M28 family amino/carboxypeptidase
VPLDTAPDISQETLKAHVAILGGEIGERNLGHPDALRRTAAYIQKVWGDQGYRVTLHEYVVQGQIWANLEITRPGATRPSEIILVGAHYDSVSGSPGANDNGTGVAALLEISRLFAERKPRRTVRFVAFVHEEPPFFFTRDMGSRVYAKAARRRDDDIRAMLSLETIGYYSDAPKSQRYPPLFNLFYPDRGNFIAFVANMRSRRLLKQAVAAFRAVSDFPVEYVASPAIVPGVGWSDHLSFWLKGYRALMVTDTAPYRYPYYHTPEDTPDKIDYPSYWRVTQGLVGVIDTLANAHEN